LLSLAISFSSSAYGKGCFFTYGLASLPFLSRFPSLWEMGRRLALFPYGKGKSKGKWQGQKVNEGSASS